ncbi:sensor histidine kinase [Micromonospora sp. NBC_01813]|uniref:sensor histidine kinase n=1 Tax=Micromonospora sp. NBC_01813 TaxID=2975988 RepID=UPI002DD9E88D|nr:histidine kinase [Micromonospora sp. NBC_01813]WSA11732.1 histidine kinase [Micromonospora sp. NBC_01813]
MYPLPAAAAVVALAAAVAGALWWPRRILPVGAGAATAAVVSLVATVVYTGPGDNTVAQWLLVETGAELWLLTQVVRRVPARTAALVAALVVVAIAMSPLRVGLWLTPPAAALELVVVCTCFTLLAAIATGVGIYLRRLDQERERSVAEARRTQRVQLARDLHDWLAHEMTGIVLAAQAGQLTATEPKEAARMFDEIEAAGTRGLDAMDRALRLLRDAVDDPDGAAERPLTHADVAEVVRRFNASISARVDLDLATNLDEQRPEVVATVHRTVVESLTNVRRHAPTATLVRVAVTRTAATVTVTVTNQGGRPPRRRRRRRGGTGLANLTKSVEAVDGTFWAGPDAVAGWTVRIEVPT